MAGDLCAVLRSFPVRAPSPDAKAPPQIRCQKVAERSDLGFMVAFSFVGNFEALAVKPGIIGSGAGFLEHRQAAPARRTPPARRCNSRLFQCPAGFRRASGSGAHTELSASPPPTQVAVLPGQVPILAAAPRISPFPERDPAGTYLGPRGPRLEPCGRLSSARGEHALPAGHGCKMDSRRKPCPAPAPSPPGTSARLLGRASPLFRLPSFAFPRGGGGSGEGQWVR